MEENDADVLNSGHCKPANQEGVSGPPRKSSLSSLQWALGVAVSRQHPSDGRPQAETKMLLPDPHQLHSQAPKASRALLLLGLWVCIGKVRKLMRWFLITQGYPCLRAVFCGITNPCKNLTESTNI